MNVDLKFLQIRKENETNKKKNESFEPARLTKTQ